MPFDFESKGTLGLYNKHRFLIRCFFFLGLIGKVGFS